MALDRLKEALFALVRAGTPGIDYLTTYRARVVSEDPDTGRIDVQPDDPRLPSMSNLRLDLGLPGTTVLMNPQDSDAFVQVGWKNGNPTLPYAALHEGGETVIKLSLAASSIVLDGDQVFAGGEAGAETTIRADTYRTAEDLFLKALASGVGAALGALTLEGPAGIVQAAAQAFDLAKSTYVTTKAKVV